MDCFNNLRPVLFRYIAVACRVTSIVEEIATHTNVYCSNCSSKTNNCCLYLSLSRDSSVSVGEKEYCPSQEFKAECQRGSVIVMRRATYGRLSVGACVTEDFGYGCENDALPDMDAACSGRRRCKVKVVEENFQHTKDCHNDLKSSLLASYECRKGTSKSYSRGLDNKKYDVLLT